ncbi:DUF4097 family beta strand repeat-containing protein [Halorubrum ezzemoulense]|uniref:DUF4097 family beta strand repeat-containing protein n=1 Tax=Halorubrum ezzemoulense TaxID=337243 RepID=A0ABT4Z7B8_HALEZ|nr:DUF4097 family beta strand repeat-containing protein [Halorubrum ezzemoulense]MDB2239616.1 DUF4097 family beta strand repeat-containing protein [Halorubrum ezzemoulense]MDB2246281.1 DUF4097 family beta strand repeat-containing protein [Halorubrum ezzemoulense]MDB2249912.1 DUF4097 family beta strand repeat-containing protein [Halorubrum ezzemoulense]MDB2262477.1 DUF4097 family beta strand repeat-containing protein [Halorubrum ezzemoulense]MDB2269338.1 DUF4097 family beta strand repeat-contai
MSSPDWAGQRLSRRNLLGACIAAGTATLAGCTSGSLEAETTVTREYDGTDISEINVQGVNGDISITLPATAEPAISLDTTNGDTTINGFQADLTESGSAVDRMVGNGTHRVTATTTNGDITIRGRERNE